MKIFNLLGFCFLLTARISAAAEDNAPSVRTITFSVFPLERADWSGLVYAPDGNPKTKTMSLAFNRQERSIDYTYTGPLPLTFFRTVPGAEGTVIHQPVATVDSLPDAIQEKGGQLILFLEPADKNPTGSFTVHVMHDTPERFPADSMVFFNTLPIPFVGLLGNQRLELPPGASSPVDVSDFIEEPAPIALAIQHNDDLHVVVQNRIQFSEGRRTLMILRPPRHPGSNRIRTQRITEMTKNRPQ